MRKMSLLLVLLAVIMFAAAPVMAQSTVNYDQDTSTAPSGGTTTVATVGPSYFDASAFHAGMSGVPYTAWGFTSGSDPMGSYSISGQYNLGFNTSGGLGYAVANPSKAPAYTSPCPPFLDTNGYATPGGCGANNYAFDWGNGNAWGTPRAVGNNTHTIIDDMLSKVISGADTFGTDHADYLVQQMELIFGRDFIVAAEKPNNGGFPNGQINTNQFPNTLSSDMWSLFVDQTIDQDLAWSEGDSSSFLLSPNPNTPDLKAGVAIRGILSQRFQIGSTSGYTMLGFKTFAAWNPAANTVMVYSCGGDGPCSDANATTGQNYGGGNGNDHAISQWVASFVKDSDGNDGIVSSISSWFMRENNFKPCPTPFPGVALNAAGTQTGPSGSLTPTTVNPLSAEDTEVHGGAGEGGPCSWTYGAPGPFIHNIPEIDNHPAGGFVPDP